MTYKPPKLDEIEWLELPKDSGGTCRATPHRDGFKVGDVWNWHSARDIKRYVRNQYLACPDKLCAGCMQVAIFEQLIAEGVLK